jgi:hypothetical protein
VIVIGAVVAILVISAVVACQQIPADEADDEGTMLHQHEGTMPASPYSADYPNVR